MPVDGKARTTSEVIGTGIDVNEQVLAQLEDSTKITIALLDACRMSASGKARGGLHGLAEIERPEGSVIAYATAPNKTAAEISGNGRNGLWTQSLLKALKGNDLSLDTVLYAASLETKKQSGGYQTPHSNGDDILKKHFYFRVTINPGADAIEQTFWESIKNSNDASDFEAYLRKFPKGNYRELAENRLRRLKLVPPAPPPPMPVMPVTPLPVQPPKPAPAAALSGGYTDNGDGSVTHGKTGLRWKRCVEGMTWTGSTCSGKAKNYTWKDARALGANGWRLPSIEELRTLIEMGNSPAINVAAFPNTPASHFWSASTDAANWFKAWLVNFNHGYDYTIEAWPNGNDVRLVRGGQ